MRNRRWSAAAVLATFLLAGAAAAESGRDSFESRKCSLCHSVPAVGIEAHVKVERMKGPSLPTPEDRSADWLSRYLRKEVEREGKTHPKAFSGTDEELQALLAWLEGLGGPSP